MNTYTVRITLSLDAETEEEAMTRYIESVHDGLWDSDSIEIEKEENED